MLSDLSGKHVLITGASTGIGAAVATQLASLGAVVAVHGNRNAEAANEVVESIEKAGGRAAAVLGNLSEPEICGRIVAEAASALGGLDILINNAGAMFDRVTNADFDEEVYQEVFDLNVKAVLSVTKAAFPHLKAAGGGSIINTGSVVGRMGGFSGSTVYAAAKAAVHSITRNAAREFAPHAIRVNTVAPGFISTPFHAGTPAAIREQIATQIPLQRLGDVQDCVGAFVFLASASMSAYITGQILDVNGGQFMM